MYSSEVFLLLLFFLSVSLGCRHEIVIFIFLFLKRSKKIKNYKKKNLASFRSNTVSDRYGAHLAKKSTR